MKKFIIVFLLTIFVTNNVLSSPLIFKVKKEVTTEGLVELGTFDATRYRQIRIGIKIIANSSDEKENIKLEYAKLIQKRNELNTKLEKLRKLYLDRHPDVIQTHEEISQVNAEIEKLVKLQITEADWTMNIFGTQELDEILIANFNDKNLNRSIIIDSPPSKISIKVLGKATYSLYIWGQ